MKEADLGGSARLVVPVYFVYYLSLPYSDSDEGEWQSLVQLRSRSSYLMECSNSFVLTSAAGSLSHAVLLLLMR